MNLYKQIIFIFVAAVAVSCQTPHETAAPPFSVGLQSGYPPFEYVDDNGQIVGFDVDLAKQIAHELGKELIITDMEFESELLALKQGKIDAIISGMNITPSRMKEIAMVPYYGEKAPSLSLLFWGSIPQNVHSLDDLKNIPGAVVSVGSGSTAEFFLEHCPQIKHQSFEGAIAPFMDVKFGKSLAQLVEPDVADHLMKQYPEISSLAVPLSDEDVILGFGIGIKKENQELVHQIEGVIQKLRSTGELEKLEHQWFYEAPHDD